MQIEVNTTTKTVVDIELPYYSKTNCHFFKVLAKDKCIKVYEGDDACSIEQYNFLSISVNTDNQPSDAAEFEAAYERISERLRNEALLGSTTDSQSPEQFIEYLGLENQKIVNHGAGSDWDLVSILNRYRTFQLQHITTEQ